MREEATKSGRDADALELSLGHLVTKIDADRAGRLAELGADRVVLAMPPSTDIDEAKDLLSACAQQAGADDMTLAIADRLALADLVHLYAAAVDDRRFDDVVELFTDTAELRLPDPPRSLDPVRHTGAATASARRWPH